VSAATKPRGERVMLVDGRVGYFVSGTKWDVIVSVAKRTSRERPDASVAVCRLGPTASRTLRRFAAGQEITR